MLYCIHFQDKPSSLWRNVWMGYGFRSDRPLGANIVSFDDPAWHQDVNIPMDFEIGRTYRLKGDVSGNKYLFFIDDKLAVEIRENRYPSGQVGLNVNGAMAIFDNVVIKGDDVPEINLSVNVNKSLATTWSQIKSSR